MNIQSRHKFARGFRKTFAMNRAFLFMLLPAILYIVLFAYLPMSGIVLAFKKYTYAGCSAAHGTGLKTFNSSSNLARRRL